MRQTGTKKTAHVASGSSHGWVRSAWRVHVGLLLAAAFIYFVSTYKTMRAQVSHSATLSAQPIRNFTAFQADVFEQVQHVPPTDVLYNKVTKETWYMINDANRTRGDLWEMYERMEPEGFVNVKHIHPYQTELIAVLSGRIDLYLGDEMVTLETGHYLLVPASVSHGLSNPYKDPVLMHVVYSPALADMAGFFRCLSRLAERDQLDSWGIPSVWLAVLLWERFPGIAALYWLPDFVQDALTFIISPISRHVLQYSLD